MINTDITNILFLKQIAEVGAGFGNFYYRDSMININCIKTMEYLTQDHRGDYIFMGNSTDEVTYPIISVCYEQLKCLNAFMYKDFRGASKVNTTKLYQEIIKFLERGSNE